MMQALSLAAKCWTVKSVWVAATQQEIQIWNFKSHLCKPTQ